MSETVCKHGGLERKCDICRLESQLAEKDRQLAEARGDVERLVNRIWCDSCPIRKCPIYNSHIIDSNNIATWKPDSSCHQRIIEALRKEKG